MLRYSILILFLSFFSYTAIAQTHAVTDEGKDVELRTDGTWKYALPKKASRFKDKAGRFEFQLPKGDQWTASKEKLSKDAEFSFVSDANTTYALAVTEKIPLSPDEVFHYMWVNLDTTTSSLVKDEEYKVNGTSGHLYEIDMEHEGLKFRGDLFVYTGSNWYVKVYAWGFRSAVIKNPEVLTAIIDKLQILQP